MKAALLRDYDKPLVIEEVPDPKISHADDVIVQVASAGVCGSDVHLRAGALIQALGRWELPYILGHETAGYVSEVGSAVDVVAPGDPVLLHPLISCGFCPPCRSGADMYCVKGRFPGIDGVTSGGFAERIKTGVRTLVPLPQGSDPVPLAPYADAGLTAYHAVIKLVTLIRPGTRVLIIGVGGVGGFAVQLVNAMTPAVVLAADISADRLREIAQRGMADTFHILPGEDVSNWGRAVDDGVDIVIDCVGSTETTTSAFKVLKRGGTYSAVGAGDAQIPLTTERAAKRELSIIGNYVGSYQDLWDLLQLKASGNVVCQETRYSLDDAERALRDVAEGTVQGRAVLVP